MVITERLFTRCTNLKEVNSKTYSKVSTPSDDDKPLTTIVESITSIVTGWGMSC